MSITKQILQAPERQWTTTEESDICCRPEFHEVTEVQGWAYMEDSYISTQCGDKLSPIDDNLYRIEWAEDLQAEYGEVTLFSSLSQALDLFFNHK